MKYKVKPKIKLPTKMNKKEIKLILEIHYLIPLRLICQ